MKFYYIKMNNVSTCKVEYELYICDDSKNILVKLKHEDVDDLMDALDNPCVNLTVANKDGILNNDEIINKL